MATDTQLRVTIHELETAADFIEAGALYRVVFGLQDESFSLNPRLMSSLRRFGGSVIGAHTEEGRLVAFAYGFPGVAGNEQFHYSQAVVVAPDHQHRGLGRIMKQEQKQIALRSSVTRMRWAFDPFLARNAHFNLDVLGATGRWFFDDFYDSRDTDGGTPSNRMIVEWKLSDHSVGCRERIPVPAEVADAARRWGEMVAADDGIAWVPIPAIVASHGASAEGRLAEARANLAESMTFLFGRGFMAVSCVRLDDLSAVYRFAQTRREVKE
jgi:predicted GNAT superfamily acetyltransferase